ncbi:hypothetical protein [Halapricum desulfuricans]|uniref:Uncharacterized protein n=1 Tax=Halapricum desulfuricans TaxID=2841257 RepID=A0A897N1D5_9EURY|nr:hypothetical protein [Halapricum desulfuricans]QSG05123.1 Uncharacterized protein HSR121_0769 [Halapricum desulfuricans]
MKSPEQRVVFAGVDGRTTTDLPEWYQAVTEDPDPVSFAEAVRQLPRAATTPVAYHNPHTDEWVETNRFSAVVEPTRLQTRDDEAAIDPLFNVPTDSYAIINPTDVYAPLEDVLEATTYDERPLGEVVFGEIRQYRGGGEVHMDVMFDGLAVELPGEREPITMGLTSGYDYFGCHAVYVEGFARDTHCANSIRALTDRKTVKHIGDVGDFRRWWETILEQLELVVNDLHAFILDAQDITVDITNVPFDLVEFYDLLGFPAYLARRAAEDARSESDDPFEIDMWALHSGATYALTHFFSGKEGTALDGYVRIANDILFNPDATLEAVTHTFEQRAQEVTTAEGQTGLEQQSALAQLERVSSDVREKAHRFESREQQLRDRFEALVE